ncbi:MAG: arylsulfatase [Sedimentisphaerales bacterium]|nr:arylsulfatase [Sedimentisphaerales bacterium]
MLRRRFLKVAGLGVLGLSLGKSVSWSDQPKSKPNIIYILADDLGYGHLGCFGQKEIKTPNIDRMAEEGMRFTDHYAGSALCAPSRCVLMTGLHTGHCFIRNNKPLPVEGNVPIPAESQTLGKVLQRSGYITGAIGKWGLGYPGSEGDPVKQGFDHFFGYNCQRQAHSYYPDHLWRNDKKVMLHGNTNGQKQEYSHDLLTAEALEFIRKNHERPFFLYLPYTIPHAAFQVPDLGIYADKPWSQVKKTIAAMISRMDRDTGRILELLEELKINRQTIVIFTSDNGCAGGELLKSFDGSGVLRGQKGTLYEGGIRSPMIARWPGMIAPGTVSNHICGFQDILVTFGDLGQAAIEEETDGISIVPTLLGKNNQKKHAYLYWELKDNRAVRMDRWKAVKTKGKIELFDLQEDISEKNDVARQQPDIVAKMSRIMEEAHKDSGFFTWTYKGPIPEKKTRKPKN